MAYYKDSNNTVYFLDDEKDAHFLPLDCVGITQEEADVLREGAALKQNHDYEATLTYAQKRKTAYPPMADYLDAVVKGDVVQQQVYIDACLAVKAKYPKI